MTIAAWPGTVPSAFAVDGFTRSPVNNTIVSDTEAGKPLLRARFTGFMADMQGHLVCTKAQAQALETFWKTTLVFGSLPFTWTDPLYGTGTNTFIFMSKPTMSALAGNALWSVDMTVRMVS